VADVDCQQYGAWVVILMMRSMADGHILTDGPVSLDSSFHPVQGLIYLLRGRITPIESGIRINELMGDSSLLVIQDGPGVSVSSFFNSLNHLTMNRIHSIAPPRFPCPAC
jgi:hypothetical protein